MSDNIDFFTENTEPVQNTIIKFYTDCPMQDGSQNLGSMVIVKKGHYKTEIISNPFIHLGFEGDWIVILGTMVGMQLEAFKQKQSTNGSFSFAKKMSSLKKAKSRIK